MNLQPDFRAFAETHDSGKPQLVWTRLVADLETPVSAMLKLCGDDPNTFLLESVEGGAARGRYSIIGLKPDAIWRAQGDRAEINTVAQTRPDAFKPCRGGTLEALRAFLAASRIETPESLPPMSAGVFGYMGYDTVRLVEDLPNERADPVGTPDALMIRPTIIAVFDNVKDEIIIVTPVRPDGRLKAKTAYARACDRLSATLDRLDSPLPHAPGSNGDVVAMPAQSSNMTPEQYTAMVDRAKAYIAAGDIFQVVLSQRFETPFTLSPFALYRALRRVNPSPYLYYLNFAGFAVVGSSPEILVRLREGEVTIRPIAGTRPRGLTPLDDRRHAEDLLADEKERAEHLMLLDLGRNDVGRVAEPGSVRVTDSFFLEYYSQVMHIVSNVTGRLAAGHDRIDALMAGFPAGTVSGAPKVRAMEIIDELEPFRRGPYCGSIGVIHRHTARLNIAIRTAAIEQPRHSPGRLDAWVGAGIVADSDPVSEHEETLVKARAIRAALEKAAPLRPKKSE